MTERRRAMRSASALNADVYTASTVFPLLEWIRLDLGFDSQIHP